MTLLAEPLLAPGRVLSRHQTDPRSETTARRELLPISQLGHQRGGGDRANARNFLQPPAFFTRAVPNAWPNPSIDLDATSARFC